MLAVYVFYISLIIVKRTYFWFKAHMKKIFFPRKNAGYEDALRRVHQRNSLIGNQKGSHFQESVAAQSGNEGKSQDETQVEKNKTSLEMTNPSINS